MNIDIMDLQKNSWDDLSEFINCSDQEKEIKEKITFFTDSKAKLEKMLPQVRKIVEEADQKLKSTRQYELSIQNSGLLTLNLLKGIEKKKLQEDIRQPEQIETKQEEEQITENPILIQSNSKLISSRELRELHYKCLNFQGKWKDFFGLPAVVFHLAVHGKPGEGKSTFCIQFADYLAKDFGNVVYISGEEGFSKTLRDKVVNNKIDNPHLFFADISSFEQIKNEIENNKFHFIFIDSLDTLRIDATKLRELREYYSQSAFITISQSTKDGKMRGSQEIIHDTDIAAKVENGIAITTKNRYHPRGTEFQVFPSSSKPTSKIINEPRNIM
jgi:predicted ATP-dependent serine protease